MTGATPATKRLIGLILAIALIAAVVVVAATTGLVRPGVPSGDVAIVDEVDPGTVSQEEYDRGMLQAAARLGLDEVPPPDDPQYTTLNDETMQGLLLAIWAEGEAEDRGLGLNDTDVEAELDQIVAGFQNEKEFGRVVRQSKFCTEEEIDSEVDPIACEDVINQARLLARQRQLSEAFSVTPEVSEADVREFYDNNPDAFLRPTSRDVRVILNEDEAEAQKAFDELDGLEVGSDGYAKAWNSAAGKFSQDQASKDRGGLLEGVVEGQGDPQLDELVFAAPVGELAGPVETDRGFYVVQVVDATEAATQSFEEVSSGIQQQLVTARQQAAQAEVQNEFVEIWTARTSCDEQVEMVFCAGFVPPEPEQIPGQPPQPEPAPVNSSSPIEPGTAQVSIDGTTQTGLPQGPKVFLPPIDPAAAAAGAAGATGLPEGAVPVGPDGAPAAP